MGFVSDRQYLIAELSHQINSPLAAIRNALYLAACKTDDPQLLHYLSLADDEITIIAATLRATRVVFENIADTAAAVEEAPPMLHSRRAAA